MIKFLNLLITLTSLAIANQSQTLMLGAKEDFIHTIAKSNLAVFFYGTQDTQ